MKLMNKLLISLVLFLVPLSLALAEQITTVAIVDIAKVTSAFPSEARGYTNLNQLKKKYQKEIDDQVAKLDTLKREKNLALEDEDYDKANELDKKITNLANYITSLSDRRQRELIKLSSSPLSKKFLEKLQSAISYVAEANGYTLVLQSTTQGIQWWAPVIDISDDVIARLREI